MDEAAKPMHNKFGFIHHDGKITHADSTKNERDHDDLAQRLGYNDAQHAVNKGNLIRFFHNHKADWERSEHDKTAGYEFFDSPQARKHVSNHVSKLRGFRSIYMDIWHRKPKKNADGSIKPGTFHHFKSVEDAQKHLDSE